MRHLVLAAATVLALAAPAAANPLVVKESPRSVAETLDRIAAAVEKNGGKVFARIDHAAAAAEYGKEMPPAQVLIFGNPAVGTGMMVAHPTVSIELPLKVGAYQDAAGQVHVIYRDPASYLGDHGLGGGAEGMAKMLATLTDRAVAAD